MKKLFIAQFSSLLNTTKFAIAFILMFTYVSNVSAQRPATAATAEQIEDASAAAQTSCPPPNQIGCSKTVTKKARIILPQYPDCEFQVSYKQRTCGFGVQEVFDLSFNFNQIVGCTKLLEDFFKIFKGGEATQEELDNFGRTFIIGSYDVLLEQLFKNVAKANPNAVTCGNLTTSFQASYYPGGCTTLFRGINKLTGEDVVQSTPCGTTCCKVTRKYCLEKDGSIKTFDEQLTQATTEPCIKNSAAALPESTNEIEWLEASPCLTVCK